MAQFNMRTDAVDVEKIMHRIRARIREKRGVDYTDDEVRELAAVKLERFLDPRAVRSDLIEQYQKRRPSTPFENFQFDDDTIYASSRGLGGRIIGAARRLLNPLLKLFFNPNPIIAVLHMQGRINARFARQREETDALNFEILNNMVVELTKLGIEVKNLKMQVESMSSRLDFDERRARALEGAVQYRPGVAKPEVSRPPAATRPSIGSVTDSVPATDSVAATDSGDSNTAVSRPKRRRRRGRRRGSSRIDGAGQPGPSAADGDDPSAGRTDNGDESPAAGGRDGSPGAGAASSPGTASPTATTSEVGTSEAEPLTDRQGGATES